MFKSRHWAGSRVNLYNAGILTMMHIYRTHLQPDIAICVKGKKETGVISLTHNYRGIWGDEGESENTMGGFPVCRPAGTLSNAQ